MEFRSLVGRLPEGVWAAPGRVNLIGEHTDYNEGFVLPVAVDRYCRVAAARRRDGLLRCWSVQQGGGVSFALDDLPPPAAAGWSAYVLGVAWALREAGVDVPGADLVVDSDVPAGAGMSSSAALTCSAALALCDLAGTELDPTALALAAQRSETDVVGAPVGLMDQMVVLHGRRDEAVFLDCRSLEVSHVSLGLAERGLGLLVLDTGVTHQHATGGYAARRRACEEAAQILRVPALRDATLPQVAAAAEELGEERRRRARHVVSENQRVLDCAAALRRGDTSALGPLMAASHASLRDDFEVSVPELDVAVRAAIDGGAVGARMTGGGFGGAVVAVVRQDAVGSIEERAVAAARERGLRVPHAHRVSASDGARRVS